MAVVIGLTMLSLNQANVCSLKSGKSKAIIRAERTGHTTTTAPSASADEHGCGHDGHGSVHEDSLLPDPGLLSLYTPAAAATLAPATATASAVAARRQERLLGLQVRWQGGGSGLYYYDNNTTSSFSSPKLLLPPQRRRDLRAQAVNTLCFVSGDSGDRVAA